MKTEFITARFPDSAIPQTQTVEGARRRIHRFIRSGEQVRIREVGGPWGPWRTEREATIRAVGRMKTMGVGPKIILQRQNDMEQLSVREVRVLQQKVADIGANPRIEEAHAAIYDEFGPDLLRSGGVWYCRFIDGTNTVSRHGYLDEVSPKTWHGGAEDLFVKSGGMTQLRKVARFTVDRAKHKVLDLSNIIVDTSIWSAPSFIERHYSGARHYHQHHDAPGGEPCRP